ATLFHLRWIAANTDLADAERGKNAAAREVAERTGEQAAASTRQATAAAGLPALREAEARAAAALQRLNLAREELEREGTRARERRPEVADRLVQLAADVERERRLADDALSALDRLAAEEKTLLQETEASQAQRAGAAERVARAEATLSASEAKADALTGTLADLTARRHAFEAAVREHGDRLERLAGESELDELAGARLADLAELANAAATAQGAVMEAEAAAVRAEAAHSAARQALDVSRGPLAEAERRAQRLDTEAKTLAKLLHVD